MPCSILRVGGLDKIRHRQKCAKADPDHEDFAGLIAMAAACGLRQIVLTIVPCFRMARAVPEVCDRERQRSLEERWGSNQRFR